MKKSKIAALLFCVLMFMFLVGGCTSKEVSAAQLEKDLSGNELFSNLSSRLNAEITKFEIIKRQTTAEDKLDKVWVSVDIAGEAVEGKLYYKMTYNLYNDGWLLEDVVEDEADLWSFVPLCGASDEVIDWAVPDGAEIKSTEVDLENMFQQIDYSYVEGYTYCDVYRTRRCMLRFGSDYYNRGEWFAYDDVEVVTWEEWHINGTWEGGTDSMWDHKVSVTIDDFSPGDIAHRGLQRGNFDVHGTYQDNYFGPNSTSHTIFNTDGLLQGSFSNRDDGETQYYIEMNDDDAWITRRGKTERYVGWSKPTISVTYDGLEKLNSSGPDIELTKVS